MANVSAVGSWVWMEGEETMLALTVPLRDYKAAYSTLLAGKKRETPGQWDESWRHSMEDIPGQRKASRRWDYATFQDPSTMGLPCPWCLDLRVSASTH